MINITTMRTSKHEILKSQWMEIIKRHSKSGQSIRQWCEENDISKGKFYYWQRIIRGKFKDLSPENGKKQRLEKEKPVLEAFWSWAEITNEKVLPKSSIGKALQYALSHKEKLETYLEDGNCVISNNLAENSIRPFTIGRKNWTFCGSPQGANANACVYSLVETAKANGLNPYKYLEFLLSRLSGSNIKTNPKILDLMMPWDQLIQKTCKSK